MRWVWTALLALAIPAGAQQQAEAARRLVLDASRALQAGNAALFLGYFDKRETPQFARLRENVTTLVATKDVASSVEIEVSGAEGGVIQLDADWLLQFTPSEDLGQAERRRRIVRVHVRVDPKPKIILLDPVDFLRVAIVGGPAPGP
jgi:hypothetical protein